jgi:hypothetical protein
MFHVYGGKCLWHKAVHNWVEKFSWGRSKVADDALPGRSVEIATEATMQRVEELIQAGRRITIDIVASALGCSHCLAYSMMHDWSFRKCAHSGCPENWRIETKLTERVCPCNISYGMQMKEKICLIGLLLETNHGCVTTNLNQSMLQHSGNIPVHLQSKNLRLCH